MQDKIVCLLGESGSGKSTVAELLEKEGYNYIESYTTRKPRYEHEKGHIFTDLMHYYAYNDLNEVIAVTDFQGNKYWAIKDQYQGKGTSIYVIDPTGVKSLKENIEDAEIVVIYLKCDSNRRYSRMLDREAKNIGTNDILSKGPKIIVDKITTKVVERLNHDVKAFRIIQCDYVVDANNSIQTVLKDVKKIIVPKPYKNYKEKTPMNTIQNEVVKRVLKERDRQDKKWGEQNHPPQFWTGILGEEFGELCEAINETVFDNGSDKGGYENMKTEAIHVAAVAISFLECLERNKKQFHKED